MSKTKNEAELELHVHAPPSTTPSLEIERAAGAPLARQERSIVDVALDMVAKGLTKESVEALDIIRRGQNDQDDHYQENDKKRSVRRQCPLACRHDLFFGKRPGYGKSGNDKPIPGKEHRHGQCYIVEEVIGSQPRECASVIIPAG